MTTETGVTTWLAKLCCDIVLAASKSPPCGAMRCRRAVVMQIRVGFAYLDPGLGRKAPRRRHV